MHFQTIPNPSHVLVTAEVTVNRHSPGLLAIRKSLIIPLCIGTTLSLKTCEVNAHLSGVLRFIRETLIVYSLKFLVEERNGIKEMHWVMYGGNI